MISDIPNQKDEFAVILISGCDVVGYIFESHKQQLKIRNNENAG